MKELNIIPMYIIGIGELVDGIGIKCHQYCRNKKNSKCDNYYKSIFGEKEGLYTCPYGFNTYLVNSDGNLAIFTSIRVKEKYNNKKVNPKISKIDKNKIIEEDELIRYIRIYKEYYRKSKQLDYLTEFVENMIHDVRKFNAHIKQKSNVIISKSTSKKKYNEFEKYGMNIWAMSSYITTRLDTYNFLYNPQPMVSGLSSCNFYRIFDKIRKCFNEDCKEKNKKIILNCNGTCSDIKAYDSIDLIPFLLIDNAIKYSKINTNIEINIQDELDYQNIVLKSMGPILKEGEKDTIFDRGSRGENAKMMCHEGSGIGLFIVKRICEVHEMEILVECSSTPIVTYKDIPYGDFIIKLKYNKNNIKEK